MKAFCYIISIYILSLLVYPCQDEICLSKDKTTEPAASHNHESQDCHTCTPFCFCNCCHVNTIVNLNTIVLAADEIPTIFICIYRETPLKDIICSIWQPPKI